MLSAIVDSRESGNALVRTLAALVPGATAGLVAEAIVVDASAQAGIEEIAEIAGCRYLQSDAPQGVRLKAAAEAARRPWLLFLPAGSVPEPSWIAAVEDFIQATDSQEDSPRAGVFRLCGATNLPPTRLGKMTSLLRVFFGGAKPVQGLLIAKRPYLAIGGHPAGPNADAALLRKLGRRRTVMLPVSMRRDPTN